MIRRRLLLAAAVFVMGWAALHRTPPRPVRPAPAAPVVETRVKPPAAAPAAAPAVPALSPGVPPRTGPRPHRFRYPRR